MGQAKQLKKRGKGTLAAVAALLILSALVRLGDSAGQAFAREGEVSTSEASQSTTPERTLDDISAVLEALKEREERVLASEKKIDRRMAVLAQADAEIQARLEALAAAEASLKETLALADQAAEKDLTRLTAVYENMKPKEAAALFETMDPSFAAGFLGRMKPTAAAGIMAGLQPETAYSISVVLAGRNSEVPTQ
ncbi:MotE family protein [Primorskyibacter sp. S187A]|uniref:MotE family protein n=1 Tax=Primorskyibacter sp. S187A TaxID=3415130 RepID=UPI003C7C3155